MSMMQQAAFDAIDSLGAAGTTEQIVAALARAGGSFGFESFFVAGLPMPGEAIDPYIMLSGWPDEWLGRYTERSYVHHDPIPRRMQGSSMPFAWDEAPYRDDDLLAARVMNEAPDFGLSTGFAVPIFTLHGFQAGVSMSGSSIRLDGEARAALHLIAIYAHSSIRDRSLGLAVQPRPQLTPREVECLRWASTGKSSWETSVILAVSERTVTMHLANAASKLNAVNRTQCVAEALRRGLIN